MEGADDLRHVLLVSFAAKLAGNVRLESRVGNERVGSVAKVAEVLNLIVVVGDCF